MSREIITLTILSAFAVITDLLIHGPRSRFYAGRLLTSSEAAVVLRNMKTMV